MGPNTSLHVTLGKGSWGLGLLGQVYGFMPSGCFCPNLGFVGGHRGYTREDSVGIEAVCFGTLANLLTTAPYHHQFEQHETNPKP